MPNHGYCKNCWWWKPLHMAMPCQVDETGKCYMHSLGDSQEYTSECSYCPDYYNRKKGNREQKQTLEDWIKEKGLE